MIPYSFLISIYCREQPSFFRQALESMFAQTAAPDEVVLVCDGPLTPALEHVIEEYLQKYPEKLNLLRLSTNMGLGPALNRGILVCRNEWIARMDSDDISAPDRMEKQLAYLEHHPEVSVVGGQIAEFTEDPAKPVDMRCVPLEPDEILHTLRFKNPMNHVTTFFRKSHVLAVGSYEDYAKFEDYHLWAKLLHAGYQIGNISDNCCYVRAGTDAFQRRGGLDYFGHALRMQNFLIGAGMISLPHYVRNLCVRFAASVMPNGMRHFLMKKIMRRRVDS